MSTQKKYTLMADGSVKDNETNTHGIRPGVWRWEQYQEWLDEGNTPDTEDTLTPAYEEKIGEINQVNREANLANYYHTDGHSYYVDMESLERIETSCNTKLTMGASLTDPVPAPGGKWKTADLDEDGITPHYQPMTIQEFLDLVTAITERSINNFGVKEYHKNMVKQMFVSGQDVSDYDCSTGWF